MSRMNLTKKLIQEHLIEGEMTPGRDLALRIDQTLTQDATGTLVMLELEAMNVSRARTEVSVQYVDHNLLQVDYKNADDHLFLQSACRRFGVWYSPAGNGVSHPVHMERFGVPGKSLLGSDSHTCAAGSIAMLAIGAGGLEVALAMAGRPFHLRMPKVMGVKLTGALPDWVSAKDVILEMLRRHSVKGGVGKIIEYYGPGLASLSAMDRHVIANMGAELGATATVFPSDEVTRRFFQQQQRESQWRELLPDDDAEYDEHDTLDLSELEPLIACPSSPDNVVPVKEVAGRKIHQSYIGSSANPGIRDFAVPALMVRGRRTDPGVSFDVNPTSRQLLDHLTREGYLGDFIAAGARIHQAGCNGCIGMGQAPATDKISLRTVPRNFPGRSGTPEDQVYLCSPETATASALKGEITDPRTLTIEYPRFEEPETVRIFTELLVPPAEEPEKVTLQKGPNIRSLPEFDPLPEELIGPVLLKAGDNVSTDEILPAGAEVLPLRSNIPEISKYAFQRVDARFQDRVRQSNDEPIFVIGGENYGQGSSREHAALAPGYLGVRVVIAKSFARIHLQNLANFGILPLVFEKGDDYDNLEINVKLNIPGVREAILRDEAIEMIDLTRNRNFLVRFPLSRHAAEIILKGGLINAVKSEQESAPSPADS